MLDCHATNEHKYESYSLDDDRVIEGYKDICGELWKPK